MIDVNKKYKTRDGQEVTQLVSFDADYRYPVHGVIGNCLHEWVGNGDHRADGGASDMDLIEVKPEQWHCIWIDESDNEICISDGTASSSDLARKYCEENLDTRCLGTWKRPQGEESC